MKQIKESGRKGFTLIELLIVIAIIGILASVATPAYNGIRQSGLRTKDVSNVRQVVLGLRIYSGENDGSFPTTYSDSSSGTGTTTDVTKAEHAFTELIPDYIDSEAVFWIKTQHIDKQVPPNEDGVLEDGENVYGFVKGMTDSSFSNAPLVFDGLMSGKGTMHEDHPWLNKKKCVVGFCGGHVDQMWLDSSAADAKVLTQKGSTHGVFDDRADSGSEGGFLPKKASVKVLTALGGEF